MDFNGHDNNIRRGGKCIYRQAAKGPLPHPWRQRLKTGVEVTVQKNGL